MSGPADDQQRLILRFPARGPSPARLSAEAEAFSITTEGIFALAGSHSQRVAHWSEEGSCWRAEDGEILCRWDPQKAAWCDGQERMLFFPSVGGLEPGAKLAVSLAGREIYRSGYDPILHMIGGPSSGRLAVATNEPGPNRDLAFADDGCWQDLRAADRRGPELLISPVGYQQILSAPAVAAGPRLRSSPLAERCV